MGQTLTHGIYLPDEGERNCYNGLAANWSILDGAVGTIAEHTSALSGKAPLVHTHTKSDVTDLFNSANVWSENQTYSKTTISNAAEVLHCKNANVALGETPASDYQKLFMFKDKNNDNFGYYRHLYQTTGSSQFDILVRNKFTNGAPDTSGSIDYLSFSLRLNADKSKEGVLMGSFKPSNTNTYDLGSSSYQWNNLYAKNYFYNGVAWGLDKANQWSEDQYIVSSSNKYFIIKNTSWNAGEAAPSSNKTLGGIWFRDYNGINISYQQVEYSSNGDIYSRWLVRSKFTNGAPSTSGTVINSVIDLGLTSSGKRFVRPGINDIDLGTSDNKWKTFNGINPGALSLPTTDSTKWVDLSGSLTTNSIYTYTPAVDGWISVMMKRTGDATAVFLIQGNIKASCFSNTALVGESAFAASACIPVRAGISVDIHLKGSTATVDSAYFIPSQGNV